MKKAIAVMTVPTMKPLKTVPPSAGRDGRPGRKRVPQRTGRGQGRSGAEPSPSEARDEACLDRGPLLGRDAEVRRVSDRPVGHDHVVPEDPLEGGADPRQRGARSLVARMRLEFD